MKWILLIMFGTIGASALIGGLIWAAKRYTLTQDGVLTQGKVVEQNEKVSTSNIGKEHIYNETHTSYYPVVELKTVQDKIIRFVGTTGGTGKAILETGTTVRVLYNPSEPSHAIIFDFTQAWLGPLVLSVVGFVFLLLGVGGFVLIGKSDSSFEAMGDMMQRDSLSMRNDSIRIQAHINRVEVNQKGNSFKYIFICKGLRPGEYLEEEFKTEHLTFEPSPKFIGREVTVYLDPVERGLYSVEFGPLLKEILEER
jgi:hypothetical protein